MRLTRKAVLLAAIGTIVLLSGCSDINNDPIIAGIIATPSGQVRPETQVTLKVQATDRDGDPLTFSWSATAGSLVTTGGDSAVWLAPDNAASAVLSVTCEDGRGGAASETHAIDVRAWLRDDAVAMIDDEIDLPNPGVITFALDWDDEIPAGALVDSVLVYELTIDPDSLDGENFLIWVISPAGTEVLMWDRFPGQPTLDENRVQGVTGEPAGGTWRFRVERLSAGLDAVVDDAEIEVYYRY